MGEFTTHGPTKVYAVDESGEPRWLPEIVDASPIVMSAEQFEREAVSMRDVVVKITMDASGFVLAMDGVIRSLGQWFESLRGVFDGLDRADRLVSFRHCGHDMVPHRMLVDVVECEWCGHGEAIDAILARYAGIIG